ncbi:MAG: hypothetical protein ACE5KH_05960 [Candidatus Geothermarchaeales archaeon]
MVNLGYVMLFVEELKPIRDWYVRRIVSSVEWQSEGLVLLAGTD